MEEEEKKEEEQENENNKTEEEKTEKKKKPEKRKKLAAVAKGFRTAANVGGPFAPLFAAIAAVMQLGVNAALNEVLVEEFVTRLEILKPLIDKVEKLSHQEGNLQLPGADLTEFLEEKVRPFLEKFQKPPDSAGMFAKIGSWFKRLMNHEEDFAELHNHLTMKMSDMVSIVQICGIDSNSFHESVQGGQPSFESLKQQFSASFDQFSKMLQEQQINLQEFMSQQLENVSGDMKSHLQEEFQKMMKDPMFLRLQDRLDVIGTSVSGIQEGIASCLQSVDQLQKRELEREELERKRREARERMAFIKRDALVLEPIPLYEYIIEEQNHGHLYSVQSGVWKNGPSDRIDICFRWYITPTKDVMSLKELFTQCTDRGGRGALEYRGICCPPLDDFGDSAVGLVTMPYSHTFDTFVCSDKWLGAMQSPPNVIHGIVTVLRDIASELSNMHGMGRSHRNVVPCAAMIDARSEDPLEWRGFLDTFFFKKGRYTEWFPSTLTSQFKDLCSFEDQPITPDIYNFGVLVFLLLKPKEEELSSKVFRAFMEKKTDDLIFSGSLALQLLFHITVKCANTLDDLRPSMKVVHSVLSNLEHLFADNKSLTQAFIDENIERVNKSTCMDDISAEANTRWLNQHIHEEDLASVDAKEMENRVKAGTFAVYVKKEAEALEANSSLPLKVFCDALRKTVRNKELLSLKSNPTVQLAADPSALQSIAHLCFKAGTEAERQSLCIALTEIIVHPKYNEEAAKAAASVSLLSYLTSILRSTRIETQLAASELISHIVWHVPTEDRQPFTELLSVVESLMDKSAQVKKLGEMSATKEWNSASLECGVVILQGISKNAVLVPMITTTKYGSLLKLAGDPSTGLHSKALASCAQALKNIVDENQSGDLFCDKQITKVLLYISQEVPQGLEIVASIVANLTVIEPSHMTNEVIRDLLINAILIVNPNHDQYFVRRLAITALSFMVTKAPQSRAMLLTENMKIMIRTLAKCDCCNESNRSFRCATEREHFELAKFIGLLDDTDTTKEHATFLMAHLLLPSVLPIATITSLVCFTLKRQILDREECEAQNSAICALCMKYPAQYLRLLKQHMTSILDFAAGVVTSVLLQSAITAEPQCMLTALESKELEMFLPTAFLAKVLVQRTALPDRVVKIMRHLLGVAASSESENMSLGMLLGRLDFFFVSGGIADWAPTVKHHFRTMIATLSALLSSEMSQSVASVILEHLCTLIQTNPATLNMLLALLKDPVAKSIVAPLPPPPSVTTEAGGFLMLQSYSKVQEERRKLEDSWKKATKQAEKENSEVGKKYFAAFQIVNQIILRPKTNSNVLLQVLTFLIEVIKDTGSVRSNIFFRDELLTNSNLPRTLLVILRRLGAANEQETFDAGLSLLSLMTRMHTKYPASIRDIRFFLDASLRSDKALPGVITLFDREDTVKTLINDASFVAMITLILEYLSDRCAAQSGFTDQHGDLACIVVKQLVHFPNAAKLVRKKLTDFSVTVTCSHVYSPVLIDVIYEICKLNLSGIANWTTAHFLSICAAHVVPHQELRTAQFLHLVGDIYERFDPEKFPPGHGLYQPCQPLCMALMEIAKKAKRQFPFSVWRAIAAVLRQLGNAQMFIDNDFYKAFVNFGNDYNPVDRDTYYFGCIARVLCCDPLASRTFRTDEVRMLLAGMPLAHWSYFALYRFRCQTCPPNTPIVNGACSGCWRKIEDPNSNCSKCGGGWIKTCCTNCGSRVCFSDWTSARALPDTGLSHIVACCEPFREFAMCESCAVVSHNFWKYCNSEGAYSFLLHEGCDGKFTTGSAADTAVFFKSNEALAFYKANCVPNLNKEIDKNTVDTKTICPPAQTRSEKANFAVWSHFLFEREALIRNTLSALESEFRYLILETFLAIGQGELAKGEKKIEPIVFSLRSAEFAGLTNITGGWNAATPSIGPPQQQQFANPLGPNTMQ